MAFIKPSAYFCPGLGSAFRPEGACEAGTKRGFDRTGDVMSAWMGHVERERGILSKCRTSSERRAIGKVRISRVHFDAIVHRSGSAWRRRDLPLASRRVL